MARLQGKIEYNVDSDLMKDLIKNYAGAAIQIGSAAIPFAGGGIINDFYFWI